MGIPLPFGQQRCGTNQLTWGLYTVSRKEIQLTLYDLLSVYSPGSSSRLRVCCLLIVTKITEMLCRFIS